jgi:hypothetical protein
MISFSRRSFLQTSAGAVSLSTFPISVRAQGITNPPLTKGQWLDLALDRAKSIDTPLYFGRFKDPMYFLTAPITWSPNPDQIGRLAAVTVPKGFVTDLASIPPIFYSWLRPDGEYAFAAVIHDYLYWEQSRPKEEADEILKIAMQDLSVDSLKITAIYQAVSTFGTGAWNDNKRLKANGEKRILAKFPPTAAVTWAKWKKVPGVFSTT